MVCVITALSIYVSQYHGYHKAFIFGGIVVVTNFFRLYLAKRALEKEELAITESLFRNFQAVVLGLYPVFLFHTDQRTLIIISYLLVCTVASGVVSLYSEKAKDGLRYIAYLSLPLLTWVAIFGKTEDRFVLFFICFYLVGILINLRDMADIHSNLKDSRKTAMQLAQTKSEFLAVMSHEVRTPLNGLLGMVQFLKDSELTEQQKEYIESAESCADSLQIVLNDILNFSKMDAGKVKVDQIIFSPRDLFKDIETLFGAMAANNGIILSFDLEGNIPSHLVGDPNRIRQVLSNLLSNAIKFTDIGGRVAVRARVEESQFQFFVSDTGIGLDEEQMSNLFKPFSQMDMSITRKYGGTGLGLSICKGLVELMDGQIRVDSMINKGTRFSVYLPLIEACPIVTKDNKEVEINEQFANFYPHTILLAEDNLINQKVAVKNLERLGYDVDVANNGVEAVELAMKKEYTLIIMDMQMPKLDGISATRILTKNPNCPPIVAFSANILDQDREKCFEAGMVEFLPKPLDRQELIRVLKTFSQLTENAA